MNRFTDYIYLRNLFVAFGALIRYFCFVKRFLVVVFFFFFSCFLMLSFVGGEGGGELSLCMEFENTKSI